MTTSRCDGAASPDETTRADAPIHVAAGIARDDKGRLMLVRKRGTRIFIQPGGKPEPGESAAEALVREIVEELGCGATNLHPVARYRTMAANEPGRTLVADVFTVTLTGEIIFGNEIAEARWVGLDEARALPLAPLLTDHILPMLERA